MFNAFKNIESAIYNDLKFDAKSSLGVHNSLLQLGNVKGSMSPSAIGAGVGAAYGGISGGFSYDGSILGGAFHGAMVGGAGGFALKQAANIYSRGASEIGTATFGGGKYANKWDSAFRSATEPNEAVNAFSMSAFGRGFSNATNT